MEQNAYRNNSHTLPDYVHSIKQEMSHLRSTYGRQHCWLLQRSVTRHKGHPVLVGSNS